MKYYTQFYNKNGELCGSDGVMTLDGRRNLDNHIAESRVQICELNKSLNLNITAFEVRKSTAFDGKSWYMFYETLFSTRTEQSK